MDRGQISVELLILVSVAFIVFFFVLVTIMTQDFQARLFEKSFFERNVCNSFSYLISTAYAGGPKQSISYFLELDANVSGNYIFVGGNTCSFIGKAVSANLVKGNIVLKDLNGTIVLSNA